jgi:tRNA(Ile)-lysidine synthase
MLRDFFNRFENHLRKHQLVSENDKIIVSVSGGVDSTVLFDLMMELKNRMNIEIAVAHINHKLRGDESEEDEKFVKNLADNHGVECFVHGADTRAFVIEHKTSLQAGARDIRYKFLETVKILKNFTKIATAHNANDNAETVLLNLFRGTGANGLGGIPVKRQSIIRPLLFAERREIEQYARLKSLQYREDSSNIKDYYKRNILRHSTIPQVEEKINPSVIVAINRTSEIFQEMSSFINKEVRLLYSNAAKTFEADKLVLDIVRLKNTLLFVRENVIITALREFVQGEIDYNKVHAIMDLIDSETGSSIEIGSDVVVFRDRYNLVFIKNPKEASPFVAEIIPGKKYEFEEFYLNTEIVDRTEVNFSLSPVVEFADADAAGQALTLRNWQPGDSFSPLGMKGHKKVSDFLVDAKIPIYQKNNVLVLSNKDGIIWLCGLRVDDRFKITDNTRRILKLEFGYK